MKKPLFCAALSLLLVAPSLSIAGGDGWRGHSSHGYSGHGRGHGGYGGHGDRGRGDRGLGWVPWASAVVIGSSLYWANQAYSQPSTTIIVTPPPPVAIEAPRVAYFCQSSRQYYPNVPTCNMPWQLVPY
jgi:hypothetical protein